MKLYHGTTVSGLTELHADSCDTQGNKVLYLTDNFAYSLFYIRDRDIDFVTCGVGSDGAVNYDEKFPDQLSVLYREMTGYVYEVETDAENTKVNGIYIKVGNANVSEATYIPNAYEAIMKGLDNGNIHLLAYQDLTDEQKILNQKGLVHMIRNIPMNPRKESFFRTHFPKAWEEANH